MPIEIKEMVIKTVVNPASDTAPRQGRLDEEEVETLKLDFKRMCAEMIEEFWEKKSRR